MLYSIGLILVLVFVWGTIITLFMQEKLDYPEPDQLIPTIIFGLILTVAGIFVPWYTMFFTAVIVLIVSLNIKYKQRKQTKKEE